MSRFVPRLHHFLAALALSLACQAPISAAEPAQQVMTVLHMLDYVGVDYAGAVQNGQIIQAGEYQEQSEFADNVGKQIAALPERAGKATLVTQAQDLQAAIGKKADGTEVGRRTADLSRALLAVYPVAVTPRQAPDVAAAARLFETQCASCHGASGHGDGALAATLNPPPVNFHDTERQRQRSVFGLYNVITLGVNGTGMASFAQLSESDRWALAFYVGQLIYTDEQRAAGEQIWKTRGAKAGIGSLEDLSNKTPAELVAGQGKSGEDLMAYLRLHPDAVGGTGSDPLALCRAKLAESAAAYRAGQQGQALQLALSAYLEGFELVEPTLSAADSELMHRIETAMMAYRQLIKDGAPAEQVTAGEQGLQQELKLAGERLNGDSLSSAGSFVGSFIILAREGLEAVLVLAAMVAFLRKSGRSDAMPYVHAGWISAIVLGMATWFVATYLINVSGASRELTEGYTGLLAAIILLSVGLWLHNKSYSNRWQQYVAGKMRGALDGKRLWGLALLAFIAVYREMFETVLFYRALWAQGGHGAILLGLLAAALVLAFIVWAIFYLSMKLPIHQFFTWSSVFIVVLAVVFTGKGVAALQEAGVIPAQHVPFVTISLLGIYPSLQGLLLQISVLAAVLGGFAWNHLSARESPISD